MKNRKKRITISNKLISIQQAIGKRKINMLDRIYLNFSILFNHNYALFIKGLIYNYQNDNKKSMHYFKRFRTNANSFELLAAQGHFASFDDEAFIWAKDFFKTPTNNL